MTTALQADQSAAESWVARNVLIVGINYAPEPTGIAPYTTALAEHLVASGASVTVLAGVPHYPGWHVGKDDRRVTRNERINGVTVRRLRHYVPKRMSTMSRGFYELTYWVHTRRQRVDLAPGLVVGVTPALGGAQAAVHFARKHRAPLVLHVQDLMGAAANQSGISGGRWVAGLIARAEARVLRRADAVVIVSEAMKPTVLAAGVQPERLFHVPNWTHIDAPHADRDATRKAMGWARGETVVLHTGNMGLKQDLGNVVEAARLSKDRADLRWVLMGDGSQRATLEEQASGLTNIDIVKPCRSEDYPDVLAGADVLLVNERPSMFEASLPSKLTSYAATDVPVVAAVSPDGATAQMLRSVGAGATVVEPGRPDLLVDAVLRGGTLVPLSGTGVQQMEAVLLRVMSKTARPSRLRPARVRRGHPQGRGAP